MNKPLHNFFTKDHQRLDKLLNLAIENPDAYDLDAYHQFRTGLLRHIKMEEKTLFPAAKKVNPVLMQKLLPRYRADHGALTALMVPPPTASLIKVIKHLLHIHDLAEEETGGLYDVCEALTQEHTEQLLQQLSLTAAVPVHPPNDAPLAMETAKRALQRAGYDYEKIIREN